MKFTWTGGSRIKIDAQVAGERLHRIRDRKGGAITPDDVLHDASKESSPLHEHFDWNNDSAANKYRLQQAGELLRMLVVVYDDHENQEPVRSFVAVESQEHRGYEDTKTALMTPELRAQVLARAKSELKTWTRRYRRFNEFAAVVEVAEEVLT